jgi:hypothetical protein
MTNDAPDRIGLVGDGLGAWALAHKDEAGVAVHYLRATPARERAEELASLLQEALDELDAYYSAEYDTDHPYHQDKLAKARDAWQHARALLASLEQETDR